MQSQVPFCQGSLGARGDETSGKGLEILIRNKEMGSQPLMAQMQWLAWQGPPEQSTRMLRHTSPPPAGTYSLSRPGPAINRAGRRLVLTWWVGQAYFWKMETKQTLITAIWGSEKSGAGWRQSG